MSSTFASHSVPVIPTGPDAPVAPGITKTAEIPEAPKKETPAAPAVVTKPQRPADIPEKFWDAEKGEVRTADLLKSYAELEKAKSAEKPAETKTPEQLKAEADAKAKEDAEKAKAPAELPKQFEKFNTEFAEKGELSEESYKELAEKHGISKDYVELYIAGFQAKAEAYNKAVADAAGGEDKMKSIFEWAGKALSEADLNAANAALASGDSAKAALAVQGLAARYQAENGKEPNLITGSAPGDTVKPFGSTKEVVAAMSDPRYKTDPDYRDEIEKRLAISSVI